MLFCLQSRQQRCLPVREDQKHPPEIQILSLIPQVSTISSCTKVIYLLQHCTLGHSICFWSHKGMYFSPCILIWLHAIKNRTLFCNYQRVLGFLYCMIKFIPACLYEDIFFASEWSCSIQQQQSAWLVCMTDFTWTRNVILNFGYYFYYVYFMGNHSLLC